MATCHGEYDATTVADAPCKGPSNCSAGNYMYMLTMAFNDSFVECAQWIQFPCFCASRLYHHRSASMESMGCWNCRFFSWDPASNPTDHPGPKLLAGRGERSWRAVLIFTLRIPPLLKHVWLEKIHENTPFIGDVPMETPISSGCPIATFDYRRVRVG